MRVSSIPYERAAVAKAGVGRSPVRALLLAYPLFVLVLTIFTTAAPQRDGLLAVGQIFGPHLFLPILLLVPFALMRGMAGLRVVLLLGLGVFFLRFKAHTQGH